MNTDAEERVRRAVREYVDGIPVPHSDLDRVIRPSGVPGLRGGWMPRLVAPVAAAAAVAALVTGITILRGSGPDGAGEPTAQDTEFPAGVVDATGEAVEGSLDWLPSTVELPESDPPPLPPDRAVGLGALIYEPCQSCPPRLVTESGEQYTLRAFDLADAPSDYIPPIASPVSLSPDGRWLGQAVDGRFTIRDLTGTEERVLSSVFSYPEFISPNGEWYVLSEETDDRVLNTAVVNIGTGERYSGTERPSGTQIVGLLPDGDLLLTNGSTENGPPFPLGVFDSVTRDLTHLAEVRTEDVLEPEMSLPVGVSSFVVSPDGSHIAAWEDHHHPETGYLGREDVVLIELATGGTRRYDLPSVPSPVAVGGMIEDTEIREVARILPEGLLLGHYENAHWIRAAEEGDESFVGIPELTGVEIELMDPETGVRSVVCRLPDGISAFAVRGTVMRML